MIRSIPLGPYNLHADDANPTGLVQLENGLNYEPHIRSTLERLRPKTMLDIGANVGLHSLSAASLGATLIHAFEACPANVHLLARNILHNHLSGIIHIMPFAVADQPRILYANDDTNNVACALHPFAEYQNTLPALPVDALTFPHRVDFVKLDVEGMELLALRGMERLIACDRPVVVVEVCPARLQQHGSAETLFDWFKEYGYQVEDLSHNPIIGDYLATPA